MQQNDYLNELRKTKQEITVFLMNGVKIEGIVTGFDNHTVTLYNDVKCTQNLIYKHAISCINPRKPVKVVVTV